MAALNAELQRRAADLAAANERLQELDRLKSEFVAKISHEIRTPMNGIIGLTQLLLTADLPPQERHYVKTIASSAETLLHVVNDILDFSKMEAGQLHFESEDFALLEVVAGTVELLASRAQAKGVRVTWEADPSVPRRLRGDAGRLRQVLTNLVGNAIKFTDHGEVAVRVAGGSRDESHAEVRFQVVDTGMGMTAEVRSRLFRPFVQGDASMNRRFGGTGLGLVICRQLVERMGGAIEVESAPGCGSTFRFSVRLEWPQSESPEVAESKRPWEGVRVLVVDCQQNRRASLTGLLREGGAEVAVALGGEAALDALRSRRAAGRAYHLVFLERQLPETDGLEVARSITGEAGLRDTPVVLLTSIGDGLDDEALLGAGVGACLHRPVRAAELHDCLRAVVGSRSLVEPGANNGLPQRPGQAGAPPVCRLLLVEDHEVNREVALGQLAQLGYRADVATNGREAVEAQNRSGYDIILMDCQMPAMDGYEATQRIRQGSGGPPGNGNLPPRNPYIIALTAHAMPGDRERCLAAGMDDYLRKPVRLSELAEALTRGEERGAQGRAEASPKSMSPPVAGEAGFPPRAEDAGMIVDHRRLEEVCLGNPERRRRLVATYLRETTLQLGEMTRALGAGDAAEVRRLAHKSLGASLSLGIAAMATPLRRLEELGGDGQLAEAAVHCRQACDSLGEVERALSHSEAHS